MVKLKGNLTHACRSWVEKVRVSLHYRVKTGVGACGGRTHMLQPV